MRPPTEMRPARRGFTRGRVALVILVIFLFVLISSIRGLARFYTDYLWFDSLGYEEVWRRVLLARIGLVAIFTLLFAGILWINLFIADRLAPRFRLGSDEEPVVERYRELVGRRVWLVRTLVSLLFGLIAGFSVAGQWENWLLFLNKVDFGVEDPQFGKDVGFYVFQLPFISFLVSWAFSAVLIVFLVTAVAHYLNGGIRIQAGDGDRVTPQVKAHLSLLLGLLALVKAAGYWFDRFELTLSTRGFRDGAGFTDVKAQLPALNLLLLISLFAFGLLIFNIWRRGFTWPILAVGLWALVAIVAGSAYPAFIQRFRVEPAESTREEPFIERNISATRHALGLDAVGRSVFSYEPSLSQAEVDSNEDTIDNVRLLDPGVVGDTFTRLEGIRSFYSFNDVDVDRYMIDDRLTQVVLAARELDTGGLANTSWESEHIANTHGYGLAIAPSNEVDAAGQPVFLVGGVPVDDDSDIPISQPRLYFGEGLKDFAIVGAERDEVDFQTADDTTELTRYDGSGGVGIGSLLRQAAFALRFNNINPLISSEIKGDSRVLFNRDITDRVKTLAPFLDLDHDPYPAVVEGRIVWIVDAYTTTTRYPYAQRADTTGLDDGSGLEHRFNYARNSVKAVVDAYNGTVTFYVIDPDDPLIRAYQKIFPDLFTDEQPSPELQAHFRFPEDLFRVQTNMWGRYRIDSAAEFYDAAGAWNVAQDPGTVIGGQNLVNVENEAGEIVGQSERRIDPQYLQLRLPGDDKQSFLLFRPFVPFSENDERKDLEGFMVVHSDPGRYGEIEVFDIVAPEAVDGPAQFDSNVQTNAGISREISLLNQQGSSVRAGNLLLIPVDQSLLYVRPLYLVAEGSTPFPTLQRVIVGLGDRIEIADSFDEALRQVLSDVPITNPDETPTDETPPDETPPDESTPPSTTPDQTPTDENDVASLLAAAQNAFDDAEAALRDGDLAAYQAAVEEAQRLIDRATELQTPPTTTTTEPASTDA